jgi:hypothetical protein
MTEKSIHDVITELTFIDHEEGTNVAGYLTDIISEAKAEHLTNTELIGRLKGCVLEMEENSVFVNEEHLDLTMDLIRCIGNVFQD